jgi:hypothetical protein
MKEKKKTCHKPARIGLCPWKQNKFEGHGFSNSLLVTRVYFTSSYGLFLFLLYEKIYTQNIKDR